MGGGGDHGAALSGVLDDGDGQGRALGGIGAGPQLIKKQEGTLAAFGEDVHNVGHMGREGGEALFNALLVADIGQDMPENRQIAAVRGGDMETALVHRGEQADGLQGDRLAAGIGAGDDQGVEVLPQLHVDRHGLCLIQQRVPGAAQDDALPLHGRLLAVQLVGELGLGKNQIQPHQQQEIRVDLLPVLGAVGGELGQDALDLQLLPGAEFPKLVIGLDSAHGLHEERHARGGHIVHQARNRAFVVGLDRHHIAVGAHGDDRLLQGFGVGGRGDDLLQRIPGPGRGGAHLAADGGQLRRGTVGDLIFAHDGGVDLLLQEFIGPQRVKEGIDAGLAHAVIGQIAPHQAGALEHPGDIQQLLCVQRAAQIGPCQRGAHVLHAGKGGAAAHGHHGLGRAGLLQAALDLRPLHRGRELQGLLLGRLAHGLLGEHGQDGGQLQGIQRFFKKAHIRLPYVF